MFLVWRPFWPITCMIRSITTYGCKCTFPAGKGTDTCLGASSAANKEYGADGERCKKMGGGSRQRANGETWSHKSNNIPNKCFFFNIFFSWHGNTNKRKYTPLALSGSEPLGGRPVSVLLRTSRVCMECMAGKVRLKWPLLIAECTPCNPIPRREQEAGGGGGQSWPEKIGDSSEHENASG